LKQNSLHDLTKLEGSLDQISEAKFREIAKLLEEIRDQPEVQQILYRMRERLRRVRPQRKPNLQRLFYRPFEDLLIEKPTGLDDGRIPRESAWLAWNYVLLHSDDAERRILATMEARLRSTPAGDSQAQAVMSRRLWPSTAALLDDALVAAATNKLVRYNLVGDAVEHLDGIRQLVRLLHVAEDIQLLKDTLPAQPIRGLMSSQLALIRQTVALGHQGRPDRAYAIMLSVLVRMSLPAEFLRRTAHLNFDLPSMTKASLYARLGRTVLADMEGRAREIGGTHSDDLPNRVSIAQLLIDELAAASRVLRDSDLPTRERLARLHEMANDTVSAVIHAAWRQVTHAIKGGPAAPLDNLIRTETAVLALRKCASFADEVGLNGTIREMLDSIIAELTEKIAGLFDRLSQPNHPHRNMDSIEDEMYWSIRLLELIGNATEAERIRQDFLKLLAQS
jgi:hypothetical protein